MKYVVLGSASDICKAFVKSLPKKNEIIRVSRSSKSDIQIDWSKGYVPFTSQEKLKLSNWDILVSFIGSQEPFGKIDTLNPLTIIEGISVNFSYQFASLSELLKIRRKDKQVKVILFAGGGTNSAPKDYSVYITSKIGLIKLTELIDSEFNNVHPTIIGPGWVKTKIHQPTIVEGEKKSPKSFYETQRRFSENDFVPMSKVIECISTIINTKDNRFSGRNISVQHDDWENPNFLKNNEDQNSLYKLRRIQ